MHFTGRRQKYGYWDQGQGGVFNHRTAFIAVADAVDLAAIQRIEAGDRLNVPGVEHAQRQTITLIIALIHGTIQFAGAVTLANTIDRAIDIEVVLSQRGGVIQG